MHARVDIDLCTGCGLCTEICPDVFELDGDFASVIFGQSEVPEEFEEKCREAAESCPVEAIIVEG